MMYLAQEELRTPPDGLDRAIFLQTLSKLAKFPLWRPIAIPEEGLGQKMMSPQLCDKSELEALLLAFGSTNGTYLLAKDELLTPTELGITSDRLFCGKSREKLEFGNRVESYPFSRFSTKKGGRL